MEQLESVFFDDAKFREAMLAALGNSMGGVLDGDIVWDAFSDACGSVIRACDKAHESSRPFEICLWAYVYRSATRRLQRLNQKRHMQRAAERHIDRGLERVEATPLEEAMRSDSCERIRQRIEELVPPSLRWVVIKVLEGELSLREAAKLCGMTKDQFHREVVFVRSQLRENEPGWPESE